MKTQSKKLSKKYHVPSGMGSIIDSDRTEIYLASKGVPQSKVIDPSDYPIDKLKGMYYTPKHIRDMGLVVCSTCGKLHSDHLINTRCKYCQETIIIIVLK